jgi:LPS sulfotransferase NodH
MNNPRRILIISSPRVGSTAFAEWIALAGNKKFYNEPLTTPDFIENFIESLVLGEDFVLKFHAHEFFHYQACLDLKEFYTIRIRRKDVVKQIASDYIALTRQQWHYTNDSDSTESESIIINIDALQNSIQNINNMNMELYKFGLLHKIDSDVYYEDIKEFLQEHKDITAKLTPLPKNYQTLLKIIAQNTYLRFR